MPGIELMQWLDEEGTRRWARKTTDNDLFGVEAWSFDDVAPDWPWGLAVNVVDLLSDDDLREKVCDSVDEALLAISGVAGIAMEDSSIWLIAGDVGGDVVVRAVSEVLNDLEALLREDLRAQH
jgi:hypothetical protein